MRHRRRDSYVRNTTDPAPRRGQANNRLTGLCFGGGTAQERAPKARLQRGNGRGGDARRVDGGGRGRMERFKRRVHTGDLAEDTFLFRIILNPVRDVGNTVVNRRRLPRRPMLGVNGLGGQHSRVRDKQHARHTAEQGETVRG